MERSLNRNEIGCRRYRKKSIRARQIKNFIYFKNILSQNWHANMFSSIPQMESTRWVSLAFLIYETIRCAFYLLVRQIFGALIPLYSVSKPTPLRPAAVLLSGCSSGIGADSAIELAKKGFIVFATVRKSEDGLQLLRWFEQATRRAPSKVASV
jgi:hypothetical protein